MDGVILAGGAGKRLLVNGQRTSKPMTVVGGKELIRYPLDAMLNAGVEKVVIVYQQASNDVLELKGYGNTVCFIKDNEPKGKLSTFFKAKDYVSSVPFVLSYGDVVVDKHDFAKMLKAGLKLVNNNADLAIQTVDNPSIVPSLDEPWDRSIVCESGRIVEWVRGGAKFNPDYPERIVKLGGMIFLWFINPFALIEEYITAGHLRYSGFMHHFVSGHKVFEMSIDDIWDIDEHERIELTNNLFSQKADNHEGSQKNN